MLHLNIVIFRFNIKSVEKLSLGQESQPSQAVQKNKCSLQSSVLTENERNILPDRFRDA